MGVEIDSSGRRSVTYSRQVAGTQEEVWEAIATGTGISSWFVPTDVEFGDDGIPVRMISHFGDDESMDAVGDVVEWSPPQKLVATSRDLGEEGPEVSSEWSVDTVSGSTSVVTVRHSFVSDSKDWDSHLEDWEGGWPWFFNVLGLYLLDFRGQSSAAYRVIGVAPQPTWDAWDEFAGAIGLSESEVGARVKAPDELPPMIGTVKHTSGEGQEFGAIVRLDEPAAGILSAFAMAMDGQVFLVLDFFHYGKMAKDAARRWEPRWHAWMQGRFGAGEEEPWS
jgi:uncharacterized protein YndB with AHSA1/START domain